mmetsp:Transcript_41922/g.118537  ORF Transcript_41922/g.118537 Transcript_41922/m.118537 type:complete len:327 (-) Transcript_41922:91-1071(-)
MGCSCASALERDRVGAPRPKSESDVGESSEAKERKERARECHLSRCVEGKQEVRSGEFSSTSSDVKSTDEVEPRDSMSVSNMNSRLSPLSSMNSQVEYANPDQTIIIFDWDDTLCPSTYLRQHSTFNASGKCALKLDHKTRNELNVLTEKVVPLMKEVCKLGKVIIVTNAKRPWVSISCNNFLPALKDTVKSIPVIYALELVKSQGKSNRSLLTETKACAMRAAVTEFYSRYPRQSWKNILSVGDALFEHDAIRQVVAERPKKEGCRTKTIKTIENPTVAGMIVQLSLVNNWMHTIVQTDGDLDIDLSADEETVNNWVRFFGSQHA